MKTFSMPAGGEQLRAIPCPLCGSAQYRRRRGEASLFVKCSGCGLVYQNPQPLQHELADRYDEEYFKYEAENEMQFLDLMEKSLSDINFDSIERRVLPDRSFLDIGCATGLLISRMKKHGWQEQGVEICRPAAEHGMKVRGVRIFVGTLEEAGFASRSYDVIHCSHLIEHLTDPRAFVREVSRLLKPGGYFIVTTPSIDGFQARLFGPEWRSLIPDHMCLFSRKTLRRLLREEGFRILRERTWGGLAVGTAPMLIKSLFDGLAKRLNFGDVMIYLSTRG